MMFNNKLVACVKVSGKVMRENGSTVYVPFGSEFSLLLKNMNTVRASVRVTIDGKDVLGDRSIIVNPNSSIELERYITNLDTGNRFKFIERTSAVEQHRGIEAEDGLIRVEYQFENSMWFSKQIFDTNCCGSGLDRMRGIDRSLSPSPLYGEFMNTTTYAAQSTSMQSYAPTACANEVGITVPGSISDQKFSEVAPLNLESTTHAIVLQIKGITEDNVMVTKPISVKVKPKCITCGHTNKASNKFCSECGTALVII